MSIPFSPELADSLLKSLRTREPLVCAILTQLKNGSEINRDAALVVSKAILFNYPEVGLESIANYVGHSDILEDLKGIQQAALAHKEDLEAKAIEEESQKTLERDRKLKAHNDANAEKEAKRKSRIKIAEDKAEAFRQQAEDRKNKTIFTVKGAKVDDITKILPIIGQWLANHPDIYTTGGEILSRWRNTREGMDIVTNANLGPLLGMGFAFKCVRWTAQGEMDEFLSQCPDDIRTSILGTKYYGGVRNVDAVLDRPVITLDGQIIGTEPGYDHVTQFLFHTSEPLLDVELDQAYRDIHDVFHEFPETAIPGALALVFTELMRPCLPTAPMIFVNAPAAASGKSLLAEVCISLVNTFEVAPIGQDDKHEEFDKTIKNAIAKYPGRVLFLDDFAGIIEYKFLKTLLTSSKGLEFRILGTARNYKAKTNFTVVMTGNNATLQEEIERRSIKVLVDTGLEHPSERKTQRTSDQLKAFVTNNRPHLRSCAIRILVDALENMTEAHATRQMGSFEAWANSVGRAVVYASRKLKDMDLISASVDPDVTPNMTEYVSKIDYTSEVLACIYEEWGEKTWRVRDLQGETKSRLNELLGTTSDNFSDTQRGWRLSKHSGRPRTFGKTQYQLEQLADRKWRVFIKGGEQPGVDPEAPPHMNPNNLEVKGMSN